MLDLNQTFMFGQDRFGPNEVFYASYQARGGQFLSPSSLNDIIDAVLGEMEALYTDPAYYSSFPSVSAVLNSHPLSRELAAEEKRLVERVIADHEIGAISDEDQKALRGLSEIAPIVLLSNIWSASGPWHALFDALGLTYLFKSIIFSSEVGCIKPSFKIYQIAIEAAAVAPSRILFIGDDPVLDIAAPSALGMQVCQIIQPQSQRRSACNNAFPSLAKLLQWLT